MYKQNKIFLNEEGSGLVLALMVLVVLAALGSTLGMVTINSHRLADHTQDTNSAYYIAEAGANMAYEEFKVGVLSAYETSSTESDFFTSEDGVKKAQVVINSSEDYGVNIFQKIGDIQPTAKIVIEGPSGTDSERTYTIKSTGAIAGKTRTVEKPVVIEWMVKNTGGILPHPPGKAAIAYTNELSLKNDVKVSGDIHISSSTDMPKGVRFVHDSGEVIINNNIKEYQNKISAALKKGLSELPRLSVKKDYPDLPSNGNVNVPHDKKNIVGNLETSNGSIYINDRAGIRGDIMTNAGNITLNNDVKVLGNIITKNGSISINDRVEISGDIMTNTGDITLNNNVKVLGNIITKNGKVKIGSGVTVEGKIITETSDITLGGDSIAKDLLITRTGSVTVAQNTQIIIGIITENGSITVGDGNKSLKTGYLVSGTGDITIGNHRLISGNVVTGNGEIIAKDGVDVIGAVITGSQHITFGDNGPKIVGTIIGGKISTANNMKIQYDSDFLNHFPFNTGAGMGGGNNSDGGLTGNVSDLISTKPATEN